LCNGAALLEGCSPPCHIGSCGRSLANAQRLRQVQHHERTGSARRDQEGDGVSQGSTEAQQCEGDQGPSHVSIRRVFGEDAPRASRSLTPLPLEVVPSYAATEAKSSGIAVPRMEKLATIIPRPALTLPDVLGDDKQGRAHRPGVTPAAIRGDGAGTRSPPYGAGRVAAASPVTFAADAAGTHLFCSQPRSRSIGSYACSPRRETLRTFFNSDGAVV
jgi:hypothetical protein